MDIKEVKRIFGLLCKVNGEKYCKVTDLAKELGCKKTELMQFIEDNPFLFGIGTLVVSKRRGGEKSYLAITDVYTSKEENPNTEEWLKITKEKYSRYIYLNEVNDYGYIRGYYVELDKDRKGKWRNTKEKIDFLKNHGLLNETTFCMGFLSESYSVTYQYALCVDGIKKLEDLGWTHNKVEKINI